MRPRAFRIRDFKSIADSGVCVLSGDGITVLAGQNEAGKTAVLSALRDFDLEENAPPTTLDYQPDERFDAHPTVSVQFDADVDHLVLMLKDDDMAIPAEVIEQVTQNPTFWIIRDLQTGKYSLDERLEKTWVRAPSAGSEIKGEGEVQTAAAAATPGDNEDESGTEEEASGPKLLKAAEFAGWLRDYWPSFVYFDSFTDSLPRQVDFADLKPTPNKSAPTVSTAGTQAASTGATTAVAAKRAVRPKAPNSVQDLAVMADLDLELVATLAEQDKTLGNYLNSRSAAVTGDFLTYWKQRVDQQQTVDLLIRHVRDPEGTLKLAFYVHDRSDQYPDQRSKGFLWFLSFYLRLAATQKRYPTRKRLLLIDEPGSYLHARAQRDVLHLFEDRIAPRDQIIYSTHSPYLIPPDRLHRLRVVLKTESGTKILDRLTHPDLRGGDFADSLSPVITAIGIDISQSINFNKEGNLFTEGISDFMYLTSWARSFKPEFAERFNIFPGTGATTIPLLSSLFTGWGLNFVTLLDNDDQGKTIREKLMRDLSVAPSRIVHPKDAKAIEDMFSFEDFRALLGAMDGALTLHQAETPSSAIKRQNIDKVLLARTYSERAASGKLALTKKSQDAISRLLSDIWNAWGV
jgi:hypothetical protein